MTCRPFDTANARTMDVRAPVFALSLSLMVCATSAAEAPPADLVKLRSAFAAAVAAKDIKALADLSRFPLTNQVYQSPAKISRAGFAQSVIVNGYWEAADCLRKAPLERDVREEKAKASWFVACDQGNNIFHFVHEGGRWAYGGFENVGE
jgi:hypothetical protein